MTLIEVLIVVTIMALVAGAVGASVVGAMRDARAKQARTDAQTLSAIATRFVLDHGVCPTDVAELREAGLVQRHGRGEDPWGGPFRFECADDEAQAVSAGPDGAFDTTTTRGPEGARARNTAETWSRRHCPGGPTRVGQRGSWRAVSPPRGRSA